MTPAQTRTSSKARLLNQAGQATMEAVLILVVMISLVIKISSYAAENGFIRKVVEGPWGTVRGMIEDGVWVNCANSKSMHPNQFERHQSRRGDNS